MLIKKQKERKGQQRSIPLLSSPYIKSRSPLKSIQGIKVWKMTRAHRHVQSELLVPNNNKYYTSVYTVDTVLSWGWMSVLGTLVIDVRNWSVQWSDMECYGVLQSNGARCQAVVWDQLKSNYMNLHVESMSVLQATAQMEEGFSADFPLWARIFVTPPLSSCKLFFFKETIKLTVTEVIVLRCLRAIHHPVVFRLILGPTHSCLLSCFVFFYLKMEEYVCE